MRKTNAEKLEEMKILYVTKVDVVEEKQREIPRGSYLLVLTTHYCLPLSLN